MSFSVRILSASCRRNTYRYIFQSQRSCIQAELSRKHFHKSVRLMEDDGPTKFSTSQAAHLKSTFSKREGSGPQLHKALSISLSFAVFLLYFCVLRDENDLDVEFSKTFDKLEEEHLKQYIDQCKTNNKPCGDYEKKLLKLQKERL